MPRHILIKLTMTKYKEKLWKATNNLKGIVISFSSDFSAETLQARREWHDIFKLIKEGNLQSGYSTQQGSYSDSMEKSKALQTRKS